MPWIEIRCDDGHDTTLHGFNVDRVCAKCGKSGKMLRGGTGDGPGTDVLPWWIPNGEGPLIKGRQRHMSDAMKKSVQYNKKRYERELATGQITLDQLKIGRTSPDAPDMHEVAKIQDRMRHESRESR